MQKSFQLHPKLISKPFQYHHKIIPKSPLTRAGILPNTLQNQVCIYMYIYVYMYIYISCHDHGIIILQSCNDVSTVYQVYPLGPGEPSLPAVPVYQADPVGPCFMAIQRAATPPL